MDTAKEKMFVAIKQYLTLSIILLALTLSGLYFLRSKGEIQFSPPTPTCEEYTQEANTIITTIIQETTKRGTTITLPEEETIAQTLCEQQAPCHCNFKKEPLSS